MATLTQSRKRVKPARFIRLVVPPFGKNPGVVRITAGKAVQDYMLFPIISDFGQGFKLVKIGADGGEEYHVNLNGPKSICDCKGQLRWGHLHACKHIAGLVKLVELGLLPVCPSAPQKVA